MSGQRWACRNKGCADFGKTIDALTQQPCPTCGGPSSRASAPSVMAIDVAPRTGDGRWITYDPHADSMMGRAMRALALRDALRNPYDMNNYGLPGRMPQGRRGS